MLNHQWYVPRTFIESFERKNKKRRLAKKIWFHHDKASAVNRCSIKFHGLKFELHPDSPYSTDLAPSDYALFLYLKNWFAGQRVKSNEEVISAVNGNLEQLNDRFIKKLYN